MFDPQLNFRDDADRDLDHSARLERTKLRLTKLEAEMHRLRAEVARLEAAGEDAQARRLEDQIAEYESERQTTREAWPSSLLIPKVEAVEESFTDEKQPLDLNLGIADDASSSASFPHRREKRRRRSVLAVPAWLLSLGVHTLMLLLFSAATYATLSDQTPFLTVNPSEAGEELLVEDIPAVDFSPVEMDEFELDTQVIDTEVVELEELATESVVDIEKPWESPLDTSVSPVAFAAPLSLAGGSTQGGGEGQATKSGGGRKRREPRDPSNQPVDFFGAKGGGDCFVFVVDNSGSMQGGRLETTLLELQRAVGRMSAKQRFYVIFYSDQAYPMFYPRGEPLPVPATRDNKQRLSQWLRTVEMCVGGKILDAMEMATALEPSVVFLLSDGEIRSKFTMEKLTTNEERPFLIHTLGMTVRNVDSAKRLAAIARAHGGAFIPVRINPVAVRMSQQRPVRYHRERGEVWGSRVR